MIDLLHRVRYGSVLDLVVNQGALSSGKPIKLRRRCRIGKGDRGGCLLPASEHFKLKSQHVDLIDAIRGVEDGCLTIEVSDGLPTAMIVEETLKL